MLEDFEPIEAKLQKVVHKAREVLFYEFEAYDKDPSPNQVTANFLSSVVGLFTTWALFHEIYYQ